MHSVCDTQTTCPPQHLIEDLTILQQHLDLIHDKAKSFQLSQMIQDFGSTFQKFNIDYENLKKQVVTATKENYFTKYESLKLLIKQ